jgi:hypothetical protein
MKSTSDVEMLGLEDLEIQLLVLNLVAAEVQRGRLTRDNARDDQGCCTPSHAGTVKRGSTMTSDDLVEFAERGQLSVAWAMCRFL